MTSVRRWLEDRPEVRTFTETEAAWLAGVVDGEGSIGLYDYGQQGRRVQIQMANTCEAFVARMREIIGCGSSVIRTNLHLSSGRAGGHKGSKPMYHYILKGSLRCYKVLRQIESFLIVKRELARQIMDELESRPFGRWVQQDPSRRLAAADRKRLWWASLSPERRAEVIANMISGRKK